MKILKWVRGWFTRPEAPAAPRLVPVPAPADDVRLPQPSRLVRGNASRGVRSRPVRGNAA